MNAEQQTKQNKSNMGFKWGQELLKAKAIIADMNETIVELNDDNDAHRKQLHRTLTENEKLKAEIAMLKERLADETSPKRVGWWENRCGQNQLKIAELEMRNDRIIELLTEDQLEELMRSDKGEDDDFDHEDSCDCCVKGWSKANEFGRCVCRCECGKLQRDCRYKCSN